MFHKPTPVHGLWFAGPPNHFTSGIIHSRLCVIYFNEASRGKGWDHQNLVLSKSHSKSNVYSTFLVTYQVIAYIYLIAWPSCIIRTTFFFCIENSYIIAKFLYLNLEIGYDTCMWIFKICVAHVAHLNYSTSHLIINFQNYESFPQVITYNAKVTEKYIRELRSHKWSLQDFLVHHAVKSISF